MQFLRFIYNVLINTFTIIKKYYVFIFGGGFLIAIWNFFVQLKDEVLNVGVRFVLNLYNLIPYTDDLNVDQALSLFNTYAESLEALIPVKFILSTLLFLATFYTVLMIINITLWIVRRIFDIIP